MAALNWDEFFPQQFVPEGGQGGGEWPRVHRGIEDLIREVPQGEGLGKVMRRQTTAYESEHGLDHLNPMTKNLNDAAFTSWLESLPLAPEGRIQDRRGNYTNGQTLWGDVQDYWRRMTGR